MKIFYILCLSILASCSKKLDITWGTTDTVLTYGQSFYCWALYKNNNIRSVQLDRERSKIEFFIKSKRGEIEFPGVAIDGGGSEISLQHGNSLINHFAAPTGSRLAGVSDTEVATLVARSVYGDNIIDSSITVRIVPPKNKKLEDWINEFKSMTQFNHWKSRDTAKNRSDLCRTSDSLKRIADPNNDDMSIIGIAARELYDSHCGKVHSICSGEPNETTPYSQAYAACIKKACQEGKQLKQIINTPYPELYRLRNKITHAILRNPEKVNSDNPGYVKLIGPLGTTYITEYYYDYTAFRIQ